LESDALPLRHWFSLLLLHASKLSAALPSHSVYGQVKKQYYDRTEAISWSLITLFQLKKNVSIAMIFVINLFNVPIAYACVSFSCIVAFLIQGQDNKPYTETDSDSGKGTMASYGSVNSLNSNNSTSHGVLPPADSPEQFEVLKQQKEVMETGLEL
jgi:hypothetical protein